MAFLSHFIPSIDDFTYSKGKVSNKFIKYINISVLSSSHGITVRIFQVIWVGYILLG